MADSVGCMAELAERLLDALDRIGPIELGCFVFREAGGQILLPQVVCQANAHGPTLARSASEGKGVTASAIAVPCQLQSQRPLCPSAVRA